MTEAGMSTRAIGSALKINRRTVMADQQEQVVRSAPPGEEPIEAEIVEDDDSPEAMERAVKTEPAPRQSGLFRVGALQALTFFALCAALGFMIGSKYPGLLGWALGH